MKYLVAIFSLVAGVAFAADFGTSHDIILFGEQSIAAGQTNTVETTYKVRGIIKQGIVYQTGAGVSTTTVTAVRGSFSRNAVIGSLVGSDGGTPTSSSTTIPIYDETIRFTTVNYGTNTITVIPAIIYEK